MRRLLTTILLLFLTPLVFADFGGPFGDFGPDRAFQIWLNDPYGFYGASDPTVSRSYFNGLYVDGRWASPPTVQSALMELGASQAVVASNYLRLASPVQVVLQRPNFSNSLTINNNYTFPNNPPSDNQILKWDSVTGTLGWEADATGGAGGFSIYIEEDDVAVANNSAADIYLDFLGNDFNTGLVGNEVNLSIADRFIKNYEADTMTGVLTSDGLTVGTNENLTFGTETLTFDAITSSDFELSDDLNINDTDPHVRLVDSNGDDFEWWADANRVYLSRIGGNILLEFDESDRCFFYEASSEVAGLVRHTEIRHISASFDPDAVCDGAVDRVKIFTIMDDSPAGIIIDEWKLSYEADPTTECDLDLKYADAFIGVANAVVMDVLDSTNGASSEDTDANINGGAIVQNGKVIYLEFGTAYTETGHQITFEMIFHNAP